MHDIVSTPGGYHVVGPSRRKMPPHAIKSLHHMPPKISMTPAEFVSEHRRLIRTLKSGSRARQDAEAARQAAELRDKVR